MLAFLETRSLLFTKKTYYRNLLLLFFSFISVANSYAQVACSINTSVSAPGSVVRPICGLQSGAITVDVTGFSSSYTLRLYKKDGATLTLWEGRQYNNVTVGDFRFLNLAANTYRVEAVDNTTGCISFKDVDLSCEVAKACYIFNNPYDVVNPTCNLPNGSIGLKIGGFSNAGYDVRVYYKNAWGGLSLYQGRQYLNVTAPDLRFINLDANYYCIIITDKATGCITSRDIQLDCQPPKSCTIFNNPTTVIAPTCNINNGSIALNIGGFSNAGYDVRVYYKNAWGVLSLYEGRELFNQTNPNPVFSNLAANYYCIIITDKATGCITSRDITIECKPNPTVCTYTQGAWGSVGGMMKDGLGGSFTTLALIQKSLDNWGGTLLIGVPGRNVSITTPQQVIDFLPNGGPSFKFSHSGTLPIGDVLSTYKVKKGGTLLAQTITLGLNLKIGNQVLEYIPLQGLVSASIINALSDKTVGGLYMLANQALGGTANVDLEAIGEAVDKINNYFDECRVYNGVLEMKKTAVAAATGTRYSTPESNSINQLAVTASPNPFRNNVRFAVTSTTSGQGVLEVYNISGVKLATPFKGYVSAGKEQIVEYNASRSLTSSLLYIFRVNGKQVSGKLVAAK